jgi:hypothetical protein
VLVIITELKLEAMKHNLAQLLPRTKPTLRVESIARGFGFARYVDLLQLVRSPQGLEREFKPKKAAEYAKVNVEIFTGL